MQIQLKIHMIHFYRYGIFETTSSKIDVFCCAEAVECDTGFRIFNRGMYEKIDSGGMCGLYVRSAFYELRRQKK